MRKALHQISERYTDLGEAEDALFANARIDGVEAAWICPEQRVHFITTHVAGLEALEAKDLQKGQRLVFLADRPTAPVKPRRKAADTAVEDELRIINYSGER